ncbi:biotin--[acetyl-CoA-carboxylase] ligase, partial [Francisella tularensis subsp. holarctica]|nr:biotin--[acetyl-CoA-carboxylase] ligase [Francisella tularensis subsp. holarctica]
IYFQDQKLAGILIETKNIKKDSFDIILGVGINVNMTNTDENIDREWTSVSNINNKQLNSSRIIFDLVKSIIVSFVMNDATARA